MWVSGSGVPPQGLHWVEPTGEPPSSGPGRRRWWWIGAVAVVVVALVAGGMVWWHSSGSRLAGGAAHDAAHKEPAPIGTPKDRLISFPLDREPVPAWQLSTADIGLPDQIPIGEMFAAIGDKAFFVTNRSFTRNHCGPNGECANTVGTVYAINTTTGKVVFNLALPGFLASSDDCFTNGPSTAVCLNPHCPKAGTWCHGLERVWVIDLDRGEVTFTSDHPQIHDLDDDPKPYAIGNLQGETRLVATVKDKGIYGVGPHAELTWFLPGSGNIYQANYLEVDDIAPLTLAIQSRNGDGDIDHVFSVDGKDLTPTPPEGTTLRDAQVYAGGYMYEYVKGPQPGGIVLYDTDGHLVADIPGATDPQRNVAMPTFTNSGTQVYTADGKHLSTTHVVGEYYRTIATTVFTSTISSGPWKQFDILTGQPGPTCNIDPGPSYVGSDGTTVLWLHSDWDADIHAYVATDIATCRTQWEIPSRPGKLLKAGTALIHTDDNTITGLHAPA